MSAYQFSRAERYAIFTVHREKCWLCDEPLSLSEMEVDHIIPEYLEGREDFGEIKVTLGLPDQFQLNSFENWMPAHSKCNRKKGSHIFKPTPQIQQFLEIATTRANRAFDLAEKYANERVIDRSIEAGLFAASEGRLDDGQIEKLKAVFAKFHENNRIEADRGKPVLLGPGLVLVAEREGFYYLRGPGGIVGARPKGGRLHPSWDCPRCGFTAWNGVRCVICGQMDDGD